MSPMGALGRQAIVESRLAVTRVTDLVEGASRSVEGVGEPLQMLGDAAGLPELRDVARRK